MSTATRRTPPAPRTAHTRLRTLAAGAVAALALTACGSGFDANTYQDRDLGDASNFNVGAIAVRNVGILPPEEGSLLEVGQDAELTFTVINETEEPDRLVEASSPAAGSVEVLEEGRVVEELQVDPQSSTADRYRLRLVGLTRDLRAGGELIELTVRFERNGETTVLVPAKLDEPQEREVSKSQGKGEGSGEGGAAPGPAH